MTPELTRLFPALTGLSEALVGEVERQGVNLEVPPGTLLFDAGMSCQALPLVIAGRIKVSKRAENGREIRLYSVRPGELCIVTVSCLLGGDPYPATGVSETAVRALALPRTLILRMVAEHPPFREMAFKLFSDRLSGHILVLLDTRIVHEIIAVPLAQTPIGIGTQNPRTPIDLITVISRPGEQNRVRLIVHTVEAHRYCRRDHVNQARRVRHRHPRPIHARPHGHRAPRIHHPAR